MIYNNNEYRSNMSDDDDDDNNNINNRNNNNISCIKRYIVANHSDYNKNRIASLHDSGLRQIKRQQKYHWYNHLYDLFLSSPLCCSYLYRSRLQKRIHRRCIRRSCHCCYSIVFIIVSLQPQVGLS